MIYVVENIFSHKVDIYLKFSMQKIFLEILSSTAVTLDLSEISIINTEKLQVFRCLKEKT